MFWFNKVSGQVIYYWIVCYANIEKSFQSSYSCDIWKLLLDLEEITPMIPIEVDHMKPSI